MLSRAQEAGSGISSRCIRRGRCRRTAWSIWRRPLESRPAMWRTWLPSFGVSGNAGVRDAARGRV
jgi:hypothetical protein